MSFDNPEFGPGAMAEIDADVKDIKAEAKQMQEAAEAETAPEETADEAAA